MENNTAKHFVLQLGSLITLYLSVSFLLVLLFSIINILYPDATEGYYQIESYTNSVRLGIAMLIVFYPVYIVLTRRVNTFRRAEANDNYLGLTKWLMYLSLLVGGGVLLGDLVAIILSFLNGELTTRFILKALVLLVIVGAAFYYYLQDARSYWMKKETISIYYAVAMTVVVIATLITGFFYIETPTQVREMKLDDTQIQDLQQIQWRIQEVMTVSSTTLPTTLEEIYDGFPVPTAPEDRDAYSYEVTDKGFKLCATFSRDSADMNGDIMYRPVTDPSMFVKNPDNWSYKAGRYCFDRIIK